MRSKIIGTCGNKTIRLIVVSDIHHDIQRLERLVPIINTSDYFICCGDGVNDFLRIRGELIVPTVCVRGNNDFYTDMVDETVVTIGEIKALVVHGHKHGVKRGVELLVAAAKKNDCNLVLYGHSHCYCDRTLDNVRLINPGALCNGSYAELMSDGKTLKCKQCFVDTFD